MIPTETVLTLRDLRGEHEPEVRTVPRWGVPWTDWALSYSQALIELAGVALEWRKDDRPRDEALLVFVKSIAKALADDERISLYGADCSLILSWEPA